MLWPHGGSGTANHQGSSGKQGGITDGGRKGGCKHPMLNVHKSRRQVPLWKLCDVHKQAAACCAIQRTYGGHHHYHMIGLLEGHGG